MPAAKGKMQVITGHFSPDQQGTLHHLPFTMPAGATRLSLRLHYNDRISADVAVTGGNTLDLGLFDSRGTAFQSGGFRGWSGSERLEVWITPQAATPAYLPGPLLPGVWHVLLGLYKIGPMGCDYRLEIDIETTAGPTEDPRPARARLDAWRDKWERAGNPRPDHWYRGELHCHSVHSDGDSTPAELVAAAREAGLDFLAVTDHNNISTLVDLGEMATPGLVVIPGVELTTYRGHANVWGRLDWVDFRYPVDDRVEAALQTAAAEGGLVVCNHPRPQGPPWEYAQVTAFRGVEVWNGPWFLSNWMAVAFWEERLRRGERLFLVGGSDTHRLRETAGLLTPRLGTPTNWVYCRAAPTIDNLLAAIAQGHLFLSESPAGPRLELTADADGDGDYEAMMGDTVRRPAGGELRVRFRACGASGSRLELIGAAGVLTRCSLERDDQGGEIGIAPGDSPYLRAAIVEGDVGAPADEIAVRALSNPIWLE